MSDSSSNSQLSLRRKFLNLDKFIDKLEPLDSDSCFGNKFYGNVDEPIEEEEHDGELD